MRSKSHKIHHFNHFKVCSPGSFSHETIPLSLFNVKEFSSLPNKTCFYWSHSSLPILSFLQPLVTTSVSAFMDLPILDILCKWIPIKFVFCHWLLSLSVMLSRCNVSARYFIFFWGWILFHGYNTLFLSTYHLIGTYLLFTFWLLWIMPP